MAETNATILIPDISGFTEFMTTTELGHGSHAINYLLDAILKAVGDEYEISEIEGDAVLMFKRGPAPSKKEIQNICLKIFEAFHLQRKWMEQHTVCPCGACQAIINLTLKFVVHHGPVGEMKVGRFITLSGTDVIVAHRLMKNSVPSNEYLLMTEKLIQLFPDSEETTELEWNHSSEEFASIGKVNYQFAVLSGARKNIPSPPNPENFYHTDNTSFLHLSINTDYKDVYMVVMDIPGRPVWFPPMKSSEQDMPTVFVGSIHRCEFDHYNAIISPIRMQQLEEGIIFAESFRIPEMDLSLVYEYVFKKSGEHTSGFACRILNAGDKPVPEELNKMLFKDLKQMSESLKIYSEALEKSFF